MELGDFSVHFRHGKSERNRPTTICTLTHHGVRINKSISECSDGDYPNKAIGRKIAMQRAIASLTRRTRATIWEDYLKQTRI